VLIFILFFSFIIFLYVGFPIAVSMLLSSILYIVINGSPLHIYIAQRMISSLNSFTLLAIPFFIIAGNLMNQSDVSKKRFDFANRLVGHWKGGLAYVNVVASLIFSGMSGSSAADVGGLGLTEIEAMKKANYPPAFSAAITAASSAIGPIVPPSVMLVLFGVMTRTSVGKLFLSGFIPGILMAIGLIITIRLLVVHRKFPKGEKFSFYMLGKSLKKNIFALITPIILLLFLITGIVTPSELCIILIFYTILIGLIYKSISFKIIIKSLINSAYLTAQVLFLIAAASTFGTIIVRENVCDKLFILIEKFSVSNTIFLFLLSIVLLILGCFMEGISIQVLITPLVAPIASKLGIDMVQLGLVMVLAIEIGLITPPVGVGVLIASNIANVPVAKTFREALWFIIPLFITLLMLIIFPDLILWLSRVFLPN